jgi:hypothetical protein
VGDPLNDLTLWECVICGGRPIRKLQPTTDVDGRYGLSRCGTKGCEARKSPALSPFRRIDVNKTKAT